MTCLLLWEAETIIVRSMEISHPDGWSQYLDECFQIPIKQLSIILWAGSGLPVFLGLRGNIWRPKGREYNYWAWQKSNNKRNTHRSRQNYKTQILCSFPTPTHGENTLSPSLLIYFYLRIKIIQAIHSDHFFHVCCSWHLFASLCKNEEHHQREWGTIWPSVTNQDLCCLAYKPHRRQDGSWKLGLW